MVIMDESAGVPAAVAAFALHPMSRATAAKDVIVLCFMLAGFLVFQALNSKRREEEEWKKGRHILCLGFL
jgi:hypothetical protein